MVRVLAGRSSSLRSDSSFLRSSVVMTSTVLVRVGVGVRVRVRVRVRVKG